MTLAITAVVILIVQMLLLWQSFSQPTRTPLFPSPSHPLHLIPLSTSPLSPSHPVMLFDRHPEGPYLELIQKAFSPSHPVIRHESYKGGKVILVPETMPYCLSVCLSVCVCLSFYLSVYLCVSVCALSRGLCVYVCVVSDGVCVDVFVFLTSPLPLFSLSHTLTMCRFSSSVSYST